MVNTYDEIEPGTTIPCATEEAIIHKHLKMKNLVYRWVKFV
jgi:hypothetical protein